MKAIIDDVQISNADQFIPLDEGESAAAISRNYGLTETKRVDGKVVAHSRQIEVIQSAIKDPQNGLASKASVTYVDDTVADEASARAAQYSELEAQHISLEGEVSTKASQTELGLAQTTNQQARASLKGIITAEYQAADDTLQTDINSRATQTALQSAQVDNQSARSQLQTDITAAYGTADSAILAQSKTYADNDSTAAQTSEALETSFGGKAAQALSYTVGETDSQLAITTTFNSIQATLNDPNTGLSSKASSAELSQAQADDAAARTTLEQSLTAAFGAADSQILTTAKTYADSESAAAQLAETLQTTVDGNTASIQQQTESINGLSAQWTMKAQTPDPQNPDFVKVSGIGLSSEPADGGGVESNIYLRADRFAVIDPADVTGATAQYPLIVDNGRVIANNALIENLGATNINVTNLESLASDTGTLTANLIRTDVAPNYRVEIGDGDNYPIWIGSGAKTLANAELCYGLGGTLTINALNVIDSAQIKNAAITNAKIKNAAVDTLQIKGNAVTIPMGDAADGRVNQFNDTWQLMAQYYVPNGTFNQWTPVFAEFGARWFIRAGSNFGAPGNIDINMRIVVDGSVIFTTTSNTYYVTSQAAENYQGLTNFGRKFGLGPGGHDVRFEFQIYTTNEIETQTRWTEDRYLTLLALKR